MAVRKFRSVAEMPAPQPLPPLSVQALRAACEVSDLSFRLFPARLPSGVRKFRSLEEAGRFRVEWERDHLPGGNPDRRSSG